ncbi:MAG: hypothetical protein N2319_09610 [Candidatus Kapabacteria bacterium]|nr:hypothetical protein [Candidatus Kapabacteria bacterium]
MINKILLIFLSVIIVLNSSKLVSGDFLVLSMYGEITKKSNSEKNWVKIKTGSELNYSDEIKLSDKSYICLYHNSGNSLEFKKNGIYKLSSYSDNLKKKSRPVIDIIGQYIFKQIFEADNNIIKDPKTGAMSISIGGVERGLDNFGTEANESRGKKIRIKPPSHFFTLDEAVEFCWFPIKKGLNYEITITDSANDKIFSKITQDTNLTIDLKNLKLDKNICYFWQVSSDNYKSESYCLYLFPDDEKEKIFDEVRAIESQFGEEQSPIKDMALGIYYSSKKIDNRAIKHFENAIKSAQGSFEYRKIYSIYLAKAGYTEEATKILNSKY